MKTAELKSFPFVLTKEVDDEGRFEGYAAVFGNVDSQRDIIEPGAFKKTLEDNPEVPILWQHDAYEPIGVSVEMKEDENGLHIVGQLAMDVQRAREARSLMRLGAIKGLSIGYRAIKPTFDNGVRRLKEVALKEFSPVTFPANELATVVSVKGLNQSYTFYAWDGLGCLLAMIGAGSDFLATEQYEGDAEDVAAMNAILAALADLLARELAQSGSSADEAASTYGSVEGMSERLAKVLLTKEGRVLSSANRPLAEQAVKALQALLDGVEPVASTTPVDGAAVKDASLRLVQSLRAA